MNYRSCLGRCFLFLLFLNSPVFTQEKKVEDSGISRVAIQASDNRVVAANEDEAAVRKSIESFVAAFNRQDATSFAAHWSEDGESIAPDGSALQGRKQIEKEFASIFESNLSVKIELINSKIQFLSPNIAVETGIARILVENDLKGETAYETIRMRGANGWKIDSLRESEISEEAPSHYEQLKDLEWMIGNWVDEDEDSTLETHCRWTTNQNFIVRSFRVQFDDGPEFEGTDIIGWDPEKQVVRSWLFDSDGGFGAGLWSLEGNRWTVRSRHVLPDGRRASSTNIYDILDEGAVEYRSIGRQVDGELIPSIGPVRVVRAHEE